jgi:hypothetical protein
MADGAGQAVCDGLRAPLKAHAAALVESSHGPSVETGAVVILKYHKGCPDG